LNKDSIVPSHLKRIFNDNWNHVFIIDGLNEKSYTYKEFMNEILNHLEWLKSLNLKKDDTICLLMNNSIELIFLYFASLLFGLKVVPIDPIKGKQDIKEILSLTEYSNVITNTTECEFIAEKIEIKRKSTQEDSLLQAALEHLDIFDDVDFNKAFLLTYTSGSTGVPKGVVHSFSNLYMSAIAFAKQFNFNKNHIFYHNLPMTYMAGILNQIILPFLCESKIILGDRFTVSAIMRFWEKPIKYEVNVFWFIPTIVSLLTKLDRGSDGINFAKKRKILGCCGTAPLYSKSKEEFESKYNIKLYESYGLSETLFVSTNYPGNDHSNCVGNPLDGVKLKFTTENEILIKTPWNLIRYSNLDTKEYFVEEFFISGDIGKIEQNGTLYITDRKKDLIIHGGINISPKKIQDFLLNYNVFEEFVIVGVKDQILVEKILCVFAANQNFKSEYIKTINRDLIEKQGQDYQIDEFVQMNSIPKNANGKIDKPTIRKLYLEKKL